MVTAVVTQGLAMQEEMRLMLSGGFYTTSGASYVLTYSVQYYDVFTGTWKYILNSIGANMIFTGNTDANTAITNLLMYPVQTTNIRVCHVLLILS